MSKWVKITELKEGDTVEVSGFDCMEGKQNVLKTCDSHELYVRCNCGRHYLIGQLANDGISLIGITKGE